jgi:hypothetical protein
LSIVTGYVFVPIGSSRFRSEKAGGTSAVLDLKNGEVRFTPGALTHRAVNLAETPFRNGKTRFEAIEIEWK